MDPCPWDQPLRPTSRDEGYLGELSPSFRFPWPLSQLPGASLDCAGSGAPRSGPFWALRSRPSPPLVSVVLSSCPSLGHWDPPGFAAPSFLGPCSATVLPAASS